MECYQIPARPVALLLPVECVADIVSKPEIEVYDDSPAKWMNGHLNWQNQRIPIMSYAALTDPELDEGDQENPHVVVLNPVPDAARRVYSGLLCFGEVKTVDVDASAKFCDLPAGLDKRYTEAALNFAGSTLVIPKLSAIAVAFSYF